MRRWPAYPAYKDSGVPWLGEIPDHWATVSLKHGYEVQLGKMLTPEPRSSQDTLEPYLRSANVYWDGVDTSDVKEMWFSAYEKSQYRLVPGDLVVCEGGDVGRAAIWEGQIPECYIQNAVHRVRSRPGYSNKFLYYWLAVLKSAGYIDLICSKATIAHLTAEKLVELPSLAPSADEQHAITAFLDRETAKLDALMRKFKRLIEVTQEQRAALISHAVTRGLDPDVPLKDSGVPWLGEIPVHWEVTRLKYLTREVIDTEHKTAPFYPDGEYLVVRTSNVRDGQLVFDDAKYTDSDGFKEWTRRGIPEPGDILLTREAPAGEACIVPEGVPLCLGQRMVLLRVNKQEFDADFGLWAIYGGLVEEFITSLSLGSTVSHLNMSDIPNIPILAPSLPEQRAIAAYLDRETAKLDALVAKAQEAIERLAEYRTALISAAVTGKIDVRCS